VGTGADEVDDIRRQIEISRQNLGEAVGALAYKADIKNRGKEVLDDKKEAIMEKVDELKSKVTGDGGMADTVKGKLPSGEDVSDRVDALKAKLPDGAPSAEDVKAKAQDAAGLAHDHPVAVAAGAAAAGLAVGLALPETDLEREKLAPTAQKVREQVQSRAQEVVEQVKEGAKDAVGSTADAVRQAGRQRGGKAAEIAEKAADKTHEKL
jgi:gas vesicle protein